MDSFDILFVQFRLLSMSRRNMEEELILQRPTIRVSPTLSLRISKGRDFSLVCNNAMISSILVQNKTP